MYFFPNGQTLTVTFGDQWGGDPADLKVINKEITRPDWSTRLQLVFGL